MRFNVCFATLLGVSALASVGCTAAHKGSDSTTDDPASLDAQNGALDVQSSEAPAFGDAEMASLADLDPAAEGTDDATALAAAAPNATSYHVLLVWGHLPQAHDADDADPAPVAEDWSGSISVDQGAIGLKRTLAFDAADAIAPRTDKASLAFTSHTLPAVDGVLVRVVVPSGGKPTLHFATSALTTDIDLTKLSTNVGGIQRLTDDEEGLAWIGFEDTPGCAKGFVHGRWLKNHARFGALRGIVSAADGERIGHLRGLWGHAPKRNADVFFAKYIDNDGDSHGLTAGTYSDGTFTGVWETKDEATKDEHDVDVGHLEGFYGAARDEHDGRGVWIGRWAEKCAK